jgi:hypothetical protein
MREFRVISFVLIGERNYEVPFGREAAFAQPGSDIGFNPIYDLLVERHIIVRKIDISRPRDQRTPKKQKEESELHLVKLSATAFMERR